jgi:hypothetical protein
MTRTELIIQLLKVAIGLAFGATVLKWPPASSVVAIAKVRIHWPDAGYFQFSQMPAWAF